MCFFRFAVCSDVCLVVVDGADVHVSLSVFFGVDVAMDVLLRV